MYTQTWLKNCCSLEHAEAFFAQAILLVEGPTEMEAFPIFSRACGIDFDALNISVVSANGKGNLDALYQLYEGHGIPVFLVFDNDRGGKHEDIKPNCILTRLIGLNEIEMPNPTLTDRYCILEKNFESMLSHELEAIDPEHYATLQKEASDLLGPRPGKPIVARYMATELQARGIVPPTFRKIAEAVAQLANPQLTVSEESLSSDISEVDIPF